MNTHPAARPDPSALADLLNQFVELLSEQVAQRIAPLNRADEPTVETASPWMSAETAARYLEWPRQRLYKLTAQGAIPHYKHDGRLLFHREELDTWLRSYAHPGRQ